MRLVPLMLIAALAACIAPPAAPAPAALHVAQPPSAVVQSVAHELVGDGFEVTQSDAAGGVLTAHLATDAHTSPPLITCDLRKGSIADENLRAILTVSLSARADSGGSAVTVATRVHSTYPRLTGVLALPENDKDCVSSGETERRIVGALTVASR